MGIFDYNSEPQAVPVEPQVDAPATVGQAEADAEAVANIEKMQAEYQAQQQADAEAVANVAKMQADYRAEEKADHAAAVAEKKPEKKKELRTYTVKRGDTLSEIGQRFGVNWREIAKLNHIHNPDLIFPGQEFKIPND